MKFLKRLIAGLLFISICCLPVLAESVIPYENYTYSETDNSIVPGPQAYVPAGVINGNNFPSGGFSQPTDIHTDEDDTVYVLDTGNNRVVLLNSDFSFLNAYSCYEGSDSKLSDARGIFVDDKYIYIADTGNAQILIMDKKTGRQVKVAGAPTAAVLGKDFIFKPLRLVADSERLLYIVGEGVYEGIINMDWDSEFIGFIGSSNVVASAWDVFWQRFSTKSQRKKMVQFVPQDHSSIDLDDDGFYMCSTFTPIKERMVKRLNPGGADVIRDLSNVDITGDQKNYSKGTLKGSSSFSDIVSGNYKTYACIDYTRKKIFCYNNDGYLLYTFGGASEQAGGLSMPSGITWLSDDRIAVVDKGYNCVTVYEPTEYARAIHLGLDAQNRLDYESSYESWQRVLELNCNLELAHTQVGKVYLSEGKYKAAMKEFKLANDKVQYSKALKEYRSEWIYKNVYIILAGILVLFVVIIVLRFILRGKKRRKNGI